MTKHLGRAICQVVASTTTILTMATPALAAVTATPGSSLPTFREDATFWIAVAGVVFGGIGTALGIYNAWTARAQRQLRVRVKPGFVRGRGLPPKAFSIEVVNLSTFAVTVEHVGFTLAGSDERAAAMPMPLDRGAWPRRLEPRSSVTLVTRPLESMSARPRIAAAYAQLSSGEMCLGKGSALKQLQAMLDALEAEMS